jgi:phage FluMu protein Com
MHRQIRITVGELRYISITCPNCRTVVTLDMREPSKLLATTRNCFTPAKCPGCTDEYDSAIRPNVDQLWRAYTALQQIEKRVSFVLDLPEEKATEKGLTNRP